MRTIYIILFFVILSLLFEICICATAISCRNLHCLSHNCAASNQLSIQVSPWNKANDACDNLASPSGGGCCLLSQNGPVGTIGFQSWCCKNVAFTIRNIVGNDWNYMILSHKKRSYQDNNSSDSDTSGSKIKQVATELVDHFKKIYPNAGVHPSVLVNKYSHLSQKRTQENVVTIERPNNGIGIFEHNGENFYISSHSNPTFSTNGKFVAKAKSNGNFDYGDPFPVEYQNTDPEIDDISFGWNIDRIDQRFLPLDGQYSPLNNGTSSAPPLDVHVYIVDTGIVASHDAFRSVVVSSDYGNPDCHGHGTHVSSTAAGVGSGILSNLVFPVTNEKYNVNIHAIQVLGCDGSGSLSDVISGLTWVYNNAQHPAIVSMSLGASSSPSLDSMTSQLIGIHIPVIAAAGNSDSDACNTSPAGGAGVVAVASSNEQDSFSSFSNWGTCVSIIAPGENVLGANYLDNSGYVYLSGTSMATPHITGSIAGKALTLMLSMESTLDQIMPAAVQAILDRSTVNVIKNIPTANTVNDFLYFGTSNSPQPPQPPPSTPPPALSVTPGSNSGEFSYGRLLNLVGWWVFVFILS